MTYEFGVKPIKFGSLCSGIEAASMAWNPLGWRAQWFSEIEAFPCALLEHHYPDVPNLGDMTLIPDAMLARKVQTVDVLCGGTPCQSFSYAGKRMSLDDRRGNLTLTFCEIADINDEIRSNNGEEPSIIFYENVPGILSTRDNAFGCLLGALSGAGNPLVPPFPKWDNAGLVYGPTRAVAWRVLDSQYFGVPQRRRRLFLVASAREGFNPGEVLFEYDGVQRSTAPVRRQRKETPEGIEGRSGIGVIVGNIIGRETHNGGNQAGVSMEDVSPTLTTEDRHAVIEPPYVLDRAAFNQGKNAKYDIVIEQRETLPTIVSRGPHAVVVPGAPVAATLTASMAGVSRVGGKGQEGQNYVAHNGRARRIMPVECERLMGFPDNFTDIPFKTWKEAKRKGIDYGDLLYKKGWNYGQVSVEECPDTPRYKALGNSWAVPVVRWIGERIDVWLPRQKHK